MFKNVPKRLHEAVRDLPADIFPDAGPRYIFAAICAIREYLGRSVMAADDAYFEHTPNVVWGANTRHLGRVLHLGSTLFRLRNCNGFDEICRRLRTRELRPAFFETVAALTFFDAGFEINVHSETGVKKEDFDFSAIRCDTEINVEVTGLTAAIFKENTVINALDYKRSQLPKTAPSVIFCFFPETWQDGSVDLNNALPSVIHRFLRGTKRVNAVVMIGDRNMTLQTGENVLMFVSNTYLKDFPYHPCDLAFLSGRKNSTEVTDLISRGENAQSLIYELSNSEFFRWVDATVGQN